MWAGSVPSDAVHGELWRFFTQPPGGDGGSAAGSSSRGESADGGLVEGGGRERSHNGVLSIFLISHSSCAFVNYETEAHLQVAVARFNGVSLRADPRCARLLCRVRRKDDDPRAGVGGQRGSGMHTKLVKAKQNAGQSVGQDQDSASSASASDLGTSSSGSHSFEPSLSTLSIGSSDDDSGPTRPPLHPHAAESNSSDSHASTNSSLLRQHFPQRYFILKSLTRVRCAFLLMSSNTERVYRTTST
jgi:hypothetical protein